MRDGEQGAVPAIHAIRLFVAEDEVFELSWFIATCFVFECFVVDPPAVFYGGSDMYLCAVSRVSRIQLDEARGQWAESRRDL